MSVLPRARPLQAGQLRRGAAVQRPAVGLGAGESAGGELEAVGR
jgi:hypothetical protein